MLSEIWIDHRHTWRLSQWLMEDCQIFVWGNVGVGCGKGRVKWNVAGNGICHD